MKSEHDADEAAQNSLMIEIHTLAHPMARRMVPRELEAEDVAQDVVLDCLIRIREKTWRLGTRTLASHIACLIRRRVNTLLRMQVAQMERDMEYLRNREGRVHEWMQPELRLAAAEIDALRESLLAKLTPMCRLAFEAVRLRGLSYRNAGEELGMATGTVKAHVKQAQRIMRMELRAMGMVVPEEKKPGKRKARRRWRRKPVLRVEHGKGVAAAPSRSTGHAHCRSVRAQR